VQGDVGAEGAAEMDVTAEVDLQAVDIEDWHDLGSDLRERVQIRVLLDDLAEVTADRGCSQQFFKQLTADIGILVGRAVGEDNAHGGGSSIVAELGDLGGNDGNEFHGGALLVGLAILREIRFRVLGVVLVLCILTL
jgi:hypothetical protein